MWSEQHEWERQAAVSCWLDTACSRTIWEEGVLTRYHALREDGALSEAIVALIEAGDSKTRPTEFWEAVQQAAKLLWLDHPWATSYEEHIKRTHVLVGLHNRIKGWDGC